MAFATTNVTHENTGTLNIVRGNWTATVGDAAGTMSLGNVALSAVFEENLATGPIQPGGRAPVSGLGTATLTIYHLGTVTNGWFVVTYK